MCVLNCLSDGTDAVDWVLGHEKYPYGLRTISPTKLCEHWTGVCSLFCQEETSKAQKFSFQVSISLWETQQVSGSARCRWDFLLNWRPFLYQTLIWNNLWKVNIYSILCTCIFCKGKWSCWNVDPGLPRTFSEVAGIGFWEVLYIQEGN